MQRIRAQHIRENLQLPTLQTTLELRRRCSLRQCSRKSLMVLPIRHQQGSSLLRGRNRRHTRKPESRIAVGFIIVSSKVCGVFACKMGRPAALTLTLALSEGAFLPMTFWPGVSRAV